MNTTAMRVPANLWRRLDAVPINWGPCVVTMGVFDGMHRGHARLIERAVAIADDRRIPAVMVTFDPHPARVVGPSRDTTTLTTPQRRAELAGHLGIDGVLVLPFTIELARTPPEDFVRRVFVEGLRARTVVVGRNFRFGAHGAGDVDFLRHMGRKYGFTAEGVELLHIRGARCSSSHIRHCLSNGDIAAATEALGRPPQVEGSLVGPVLQVPPGTAMPTDGPYRGLLSIGCADPDVVDVLVKGGHALILGRPALSPRPSSAALAFLAAEPGI